jgi:hypothetical protein
VCAVDGRKQELTIDDAHGTRIEIEFLVILVV